MIRSLALAAALVLAGCSDPALTQRVTDLEAKVAAIEAKTAQAPAPGMQAPSNVDETAADAVAARIAEAQKAGNADAVKAACTELQQNFRASKAFRAQSRVCEEAVVIGKDAGEMAVEKWFQGKSDMTQGKATLLIFFESWCPHCRKEVPNIEATYKKFNGQGLNVIGLTRVSKSATDDKVMELLKEHAVTYPVAKETGAMADNFGVRGIPAAAVVKNGKVVWRGHPARLTDEQITGWLQ